MTTFKNFNSFGIPNGVNYKHIPNCDNNYAITDTGEIYSKYTRRILKGGVYKGGYRYCVIRIGGKNVTVKHHRLVAQMFIDNPNNYPNVNHIDENKQNNNLSNLEWCTTKYNNSHATRLKRCSDSMSVPIYVYTLSDGVYTLLSFGDGPTAAAKKYKVSLRAIYATLRGYKEYHRKGNICYVFKYNRL